MFCFASTQKQPLCISRLVIFLKYDNPACNWYENCSSPVKTLLMDHYLWQAADEFWLKVNLFLFLSLLLHYINMQTGKLASPQEVFEGRRERAARPKLGTPINGLVPQAWEENEDLHDRGGGHWRKKRITVGDVPKTRSHMAGSKVYSNIRLCCSAWYLIWKPLCSVL